MDDSFTLYDLKVEVVATEKPMVCGHKEGDFFLVEGEDLVFPQTRSFSMYALSALLPLLPAKQRPLQENDWMLSDSLIACPDPNCGARFKITRTRKRVLRHGDCTVVPVKEASRDGTAQKPSRDDTVQGPARDGAVQGPSRDDAAEEPSRDDAVKEP